MNRILGAGRTIVICLIFSLAFMTLEAQNSDPIAEITNDPQSEGAIFGISVLNEQGERLINVNGATRMIPASTLKLVTTLTSLDILGENYRYTTQVGYTGDIIEGGILDGDLVIKGSGDPSLGSPEFDDVDSFDEVLDKIVNWVSGEGIKCIDGEILLDGTLFDESPVHGSWAWDDLTNYYTAGAWGLNVHENLYHLYFSRGPESDRPTSIDRVDPEVPGLKIENFVTTGARNSGDNAYLFGDPYQFTRWVQGTIPAGNGNFRIKGAIPNPMTFFGFHLSKKLEEEGIVSKGFAARHEQGQINALGHFESPYLFDLADYANAISNNLFCEAFFRTLGAHEFEEGSFDTGSKAIRNHLKTLGLDINGIVIKDGSGLSSRNRVTPNFLSQFVHLYSSKLGLERMKSVLPKAGEEGSVRNLLNRRPSQDFSWLKSGSINSVLAYAGIIQSRSGAHLSVAVMANGHSSNRKVRAQIEKIIEHIYQQY